MTIYYVNCEYDISLNIDGNSGAYSTEDAMISAVKVGILNSGLDDTMDELDDEGLIFFEELED